MVTLITQMIVKVGGPLNNSSTNASLCSQAHLAKLELIISSQLFFMEYIYVPSTILSPSQTLSYFRLITVLEGRCFLLLKIRLKEGFPCGSAGKESACNAGDLGSIPGLGRSPEEGKGYPLQYSDLENCMECIVMESQRAGHN